MPVIEVTDQYVNTGDRVFVTRRDHYGFDSVTWSIVYVPENMERVNTISTHNGYAVLKSRADEFAGMGDDRVKAIGEADAWEILPARAEVYFSGAGFGNPRFSMPAVNTWDSGLIAAWAKVAEVAVRVLEDASVYAAEVEYQKSLKRAEGVSAREDRTRLVDGRREVQWVVSSRVSAVEAYSARHLIRGDVAVATRTVCGRALPKVSRWVVPYGEDALCAACARAADREGGAS